jgi:hypothetical protein
VNAAATCSVASRPSFTSPCCPAATAGTPIPAIVSTGGVHVTVVSSLAAITTK